MGSHSLVWSTSCSSFSFSSVVQNERPANVSESVNEYFTMNHELQCTVKFIFFVALIKHEIQMKYKSIWWVFRLSWCVLRKHSRNTCKMWNMKVYSRPYEILFFWRTSWARDFLKILYFEIYLFWSTSCTRYVFLYSDNIHITTFCTYDHRPYR